MKKAAVVALAVLVGLLLAAPFFRGEAEAEVPDPTPTIGPPRESEPPEWMTPYVKPVALLEPDPPDTGATMPEPELEDVGAPLLQPEAPSEQDVEMLACGIYQEAGGDACSDLCRYMVGDTILNRIDDDRFPDTLEGVLTEKGQYGRFYWDGIKWPSRASNPGEAAAVQRAYDTARALLSGEHSWIYGQGYVWQAEFPQGTGVIAETGLYFGR